MSSDNAATRGLPLIVTISQLALATDGDTSFWQSIANRDLSFGMPATMLASPLSLICRHVPTWARKRGHPHPRATLPTCPHAHLCARYVHDLEVPTEAREASRGDALHVLAAAQSQYAQTSDSGEALLHVKARQ